MSPDDIRIYGDAVLRQQAKPVEVFDGSLKAVVEDMFTTMFEAEGIGLAAPQVGISKAFLVIGLPQEKEEPLRLFFANPVVIEVQGEGIFEEGCLSIPDIREDVARPEWIRLQFQDIKGQKREFETDGLLARVLQHEIDHLNGILFVDRISPARKSLLKNSLKKLVQEK